MTTYEPRKLLNFQNNLKKAQLLVQQGNDINSADANGKTLILYAAREGDIDTVKFLVENKADINKVDINGRTPLIEAAHNTRLKIAEYLIKNGANIDIADNQGRTAIMHASVINYFPIIKLLTDSNAKIECLDKSGNSAITLMNKATDDITEFVKRFDSKKHKGPFFYAINNLNLLRRVLAFIESNEEDIRNKYVDINKLDKNHNSVLHFASHKGNLDIVTLIVEANAELDLVNSNGKTPLIYAIENNHTEVALYLLSAGANPNVISGSNELTTLMLATNRHNLQVITALINEGADPYFANEKGQTASDLARIKGFSEIADYLDRYFLDVIKSGDIKKTQELIEKHKTLLNLTIDGGTPLIIAIKNNLTELALYLIEKKADVHASDNDKNSPLMLAAEKGNIDIVSSLLAHNANIYAVNNEGKTAQQIATDKGHHEIENDIASSDPLLVLKPNFIPYNYDDVLPGDANDTIGNVE